MKDVNHVYNLPTIFQVNKNEGFNDSILTLRKALTENPTYFLINNMVDFLTE